MKESAEESVFLSSWVPGARVLSGGHRLSQPNSTPFAKCYHTHTITLAFLFQSHTWIVNVQCNLATLQRHFFPCVEKKKKETFARHQVETCVPPSAALMVSMVTTEASPCRIKSPFDRSSLCRGLRSCCLCRALSVVVDGRLWKNIPVFI